jgi:predicted DsbA family dithiol-disulfide isomerase
MKHELEVFFDYACPFCFRAHQYLTELKPEYPDIQIVWRPCEAHPRPERYGPHSDLCIQGFFFAQDHGVDVLAYHDRMFQAAMVERIDIESIDVLSEYVKDIVNVEDFRLALQQGTYQKAVLDANDLAYEHNGVWAVPAYRMDGQKLDAVENIGVTKQKLQEFFRENQIKK